MKKNYNGGATRWWKKFEDMYNCLHSIPACDRRTDGRTDRQTDILWRHSPRYAYASSGINHGSLARPPPWDLPDVKFRSLAAGNCCKVPYLYGIGESNPVPASGLWSGSSSIVNQFVHAAKSVDTQHFIKSMHAFLSNLANRQTDKHGKNM